MASKKNIVCSDCGGENVRRDAWSEWDPRIQEWILADVYDSTYCLDCDQEVRLDEVEIG